MEPVVPQQVPWLESTGVKITPTLILDQPKHVPQVPNVDMRFCCFQALLSLNFQHRKDVSELKWTFWGSKQRHETVASDARPRSADTCVLMESGIHLL